MSKNSYKRIFETLLFIISLVTQVSPLKVTLLNFDIFRLHLNSGNIQIQQKHVKPSFTIINKLFFEI